MRSERVKRRKPIYSFSFFFEGFCRIMPTKRKMWATPEYYYAKTEKREREAIGS